MINSVYAMWQRLLADASLLQSWGGWLGAGRQVTTVDWLFGVLAAVALLAWFGLWFWGHRTKDKLLRDYLKRWGLLLLAWGIIGFLWFLARYEYAQVLGSRVVYAGLLVLIAAWATWLLVYRLRIFPKERQKWQQMEIKAKYFKTR